MSETPPPSNGHDERRDVLTNLPRTRPQRPSARRSAASAKPKPPRAAKRPAAAKPARAKTAKPAARPPAAAKPGRKPVAERPSHATNAAGAKPRTPPAAEHQSGAEEVLTTAVQAAGELAQLGLTLGTQLVKSALSRLPKP